MLVAANWNDTKWQHERFNKLLVDARAELDEKKRGELYMDMQSIVRDEAATVIPMFADVVVAANAKLKYKDFASNQNLDGLKCSERWWFA